jgi:hypothetical protein
VDVAGLRGGGDVMVLLPGEEGEARKADGVEVQVERMNNDGDSAYCGQKRKR